MNITGLKIIWRQEKNIFTACCFMLPLEVPKKLIWLISILMPLQSNIFNMMIIIFYSVSWNMICFMQDNMLQKSLLPLNLNHLYIVHCWVIWVGSLLPIKLWHILLGKISSSIVIIRWFNEKTGEYYIFNYISDHVTLVQLVETSVNVNHAVSITGCWIYDSNYKISLPLIK